jgi:hypothetical protein
MTGTHAIRALPAALGTLLTLALLGAPVAAAGNELTRPVYTRPATTPTGFVAEGYFEYFDGLDLQEAVDLEGWTAGFDFSFPFNRTMQLRFQLPVRTEAEGTFIDGSGEADIEGWGGTFDFAAITFEHQLVGTDGGPNRLGWFGGLGHRLAVLETGTPDRYNHQGRNAHVGLRYDRLLGNGGTFFLDSELRFYETSDDLNPGDLIDDRFWLVALNAAWLSPQMGAVTVGAELLTELIAERVAVSVVPEIIVAGSRTLDLKLAVPVGLTSDAPEWGAQFRLTLAL